jgi:hypothetical protein
MIGAPMICSIARPPVTYQRYVLALIRPGPGAAIVEAISQAPRQRRITMYAQLTYFDGPRTPEQVAAADFAGRNRIEPAVRQLGQPFRVYVLRRDDGSEVVVSIADSEQALLDAQKAILGSELLPGEDPALLPGPDRIELYPVIASLDAGPAGQTSHTGS